MKSTALIVITDGYMRRVMSAQFERADFDVTTADSGAEVLAQFQRQSFDVLILDDNITDISAVLVLETLQMQPNGKNAHTVLVSGDYDKPETPADFVLLKPIKSTELNDLTRKLSTAAARTIPYGEHLRATLRERLGQQRL
jgi:CheY-like chemotaxis protein